MSSMQKKNPKKPKGNKELLNFFFFKEKMTSKGFFFPEIRVPFLKSGILKQGLGSACRQFTPETIFCHFSERPICSMDIVIVGVERKNFSKKKVGKNGLQVFI